MLAKQSAIRGSERSICDPNLFWNPVPSPTSPLSSQVCCLTYPSLPLCRRPSIATNRGGDAGQNPAAKGGRGEGWGRKYYLALYPKGEGVCWPYKKPYSKKQKDLLYRIADKVYLFSLYTYGGEANFYKTLLFLNQQLASFQEKQYFHISGYFLF